VFGLIKDPPVGGPYHRENYAPNHRAPVNILELFFQEIRGPEGPQHSDDKCRYANPEEKQRGVPTDGQGPQSFKKLRSRRNFHHRKLLLLIVKTKIIPNLNIF